MSSTPPTDEARAVRPGEELDLHAVDTWLKAQVPALEGTPQVTQYSGGASNWTYRLQYGNRDLILRRPPAGTKAKSAHDMGREFSVQKALKPAYPAVPTMVALCQDPAVLGTEFYVMERIAGLIPRSRLPPGLHLDAAQTRQLCLNVIDKLIELHRVDYQAAGLASLGKGKGYPRRQVEGWSDRYEKARTWNVPSFRSVRGWLEAHTPEDIATCVIHNDWRFDNVVLDPERPTEVIGVLDWEMATLGDPLMDLGSALAYWVQADDDRVLRATRRQPTHLPGMLRREEVVAYYLERTGLKPAHWVFYEVYGLFRLSVIAQQIYYRYHHGQTRNPAFKHFWLIVNYLHWRCRGLIKKSRAIAPGRG
ncbi:phosphotransferase family protein [Stigmatella aurantiaca]|uniref:Aminoglycoside phosphotransferase n=1 Tax=Stigmatella aurantiaca (strain DW4/3-1) TaxID=378806 RepID=Q09DE6_STIAD|nr:phosphotransferase family protein [Stigmatella aurantiaca]ADO69365.1 Phosphotransferase enzyme family protein [Stigmatella aurantiaca DW4/3-1]EAU69721.1 aminoglycoside phosphotransferase [Stigmatella aurantiaca DW4/3-1]